MSMIPFARRSRRVALCVVAMIGNLACGTGVGSKAAFNEETSSTSDSLTGWTNSPSWTSLGGATSGVAVTEGFDFPIKLDVWASGPTTGNHALWRRELSRPSLTWSSWKRMNDGPSSSAGTGLQGAPSFMRRPFDDKLIVVVKDLANVIQWNLWDDVFEEWDPPGGLGWNTLGPAPTTCTGSPVMSAGPGGDGFWVFALSLGTSPISSRSPVVMATHHDAVVGWSAWSSWGAPPSGAASGPSVVGNSSVVSVWVRGVKGNLYNRRVETCPGATCTSMSPWEDMGMPAGVQLTGTPAATFAATNTLVDVYSLGVNGNLYVHTPSAGWTLHRAAPSGAVAGINPTVAARYCGTTVGCGLDLVAVGASNAVFYSSAFEQ